MKNTRQLADGGNVAPPLAPEAQAPAGPEAGGQDQIMGMLEQYSQTRDAEIAVQIADLLLVEMGLGEGEQTPSVEEPATSPPPLAGGAPEGVPAFRKGGKISAIAQFELNKKK
jgi:hypothetical protein